MRRGFFRTLNDAVMLSSASHQDTIRAHARRGAGGEPEPGLEADGVPALRFEWFCAFGTHGRDVGRRLWRQQAGRSRRKRISPADSDIFIRFHRAIRGRAGIILPLLQSSSPESLSQTSRSSWPVMAALSGAAFCQVSLLRRRRDSRASRTFLARPEGSPT